MSILTDQTAGRALERADLVAGLRDLADALEAQDGPLPVVHGSYHVPPGAPREREARLNEIAAVLGADVTTDRMGARIARRWFGPVCVAAVVGDPDRGTLRHLERARGLRALGAGSGDAA